MRGEENICDIAVGNVQKLPRVFHVETTWKRLFPRRFHVVSTWNTRGMFVGLVQTSRSKKCKKLHINISKHSTALYFNNSIQVFCITIHLFCNRFVYECFVFIESLIFQNIQLLL